MTRTLKNIFERESMSKLLDEENGRWSTYAIGEIASCVLRLETYPFSTTYRQNVRELQPPPPPDGFGVPIMGEIQWRYESYCKHSKY